jgi:polynucleotide 5'-kinase involved in rRNA processing
MSKEWDDKDNKYLSTSLIVKKNINIVLIGHVNSGKSTLTGNILKELN